MPRAAWVTTLAIPCGLAILCGLAALGPPAAEPPTRTRASAQPIRAAVADEPLDLIPAEGLLCWKGRPFPDTEQAPTGPSPLSTLIEMGARIADAKTQLTLRIFETLGVTVRYPFAITLIDARARPARQDGTGSKVDRLRIAAVVKTEGKSEPFRRIIQKVVNEQTDAGVAELEKKQVGRWTYQELRDSRLPQWCVIAWGELDQHFVLTFGEGVWPLIASVALGKTASVSHDEWVAKIHKQRPEEPLIEVIVAVQDIRERLDPFVQGRATAFFKAWRIAAVRRTHWALGFEGRALYCLANFRTEDNTVRRLYADPGIREKRFLQTVPDESRYAIYRLPVATFLPRLISSFYATRSEEDRKAAAQLWEKIQADLGIDVEGDALAHLGKTIVAHNYPPHPFHLPLAFTALIEIRSEPAKVRRTLETLLGAWQEAIEEAAEESGVRSPLHIRHDDDGVWYVEILFFNAVAWTFTDQFIVTSYSPKALRDYLDQAGDRAGKRE